jgi:hypothetical protein
MVRSLRLAVRTSPSHGENRSSILLGSASDLNGLPDLIAERPAASQRSNFAENVLGPEPTETRLVAGGRSGQPGHGTHTLDHGVVPSQATGQKEKAPQFRGAFPFLDQPR